MIVYVLTGYLFEESEVFEVFSKKETADKYCGLYNKGAIQDDRLTGDPKDWWFEVTENAVNYE